MKLTKAQEQKAQDLAREILGNVEVLNMGTSYVSFQQSQRRSWDKVAATNVKIATRVNEILEGRKMIKVEEKVVEAKCDACKKNLVDKHKPHNTNFGLLRPRFGYGSRLDDVGQGSDYHLCEDCWEKALAAVGIKVE